MKSAVLLFLSVLVLIRFTEGQEEQISENSIVESDGQYFMPYSKGVKEKTIVVNSEVAKLRPSQVSAIKRKLKSCTSCFYNDTLFNPLVGLKVVFKEEIGQMDGINDLVRWIPSSVEIDFFTTLSKDSFPFWDATSDAWMAIHFNNPKKLTGNPVIDDIYLEPVETGIFAEWTEYDRVSVPNRIRAVKKSNVPWFEPVSREDFILTLITFFQSSIEKAEKTNVKSSSRSASNPVLSEKDEERKKFSGDLEKIRRYDPELADNLMQSFIEFEKSSLPANSENDNTNRMDKNIMLNTWREAVRKLKAEMNAMSPLERKSQAWWSNTEDSNVSGLTVAGFSGSRPLVRLNKNLIDKTKSGSLIQMIVTEWSVPPDSDFSDMSGYNLVYDKISQLGNNKKLWEQVINLIDQ
jgi:hypothetical protein